MKECELSGREDDDALVKEQRIKKNELVEGKKRKKTRN